MPRRIDDWLRQAEKDLKHAQHALKAGDYEWSCFAAQQSAEKAMKALLQSLGADHFGHSILKMIKDLPVEIKDSKNLIKSAANLDKYYLIARYPNGFSSGAPMDFFDLEDAEKAIKDASEIINYVKNNIS